MRKQLAWILILGSGIVSAARAQNNTQQSHTMERVDASPGADAQVNVQAYIELLRSDVRHQKAEVMGSVMQLSAADAAKF
jgi:hypothetical protein